MGKLIKIDIEPVTNQSLRVPLNGQNCSILLTQRNQRLFCSLTVNNEYVWRSLLCHDRTVLREFTTSKFVGNFIFVDALGTSDPTYEGLGTRYQFFYLTDDVILPPNFQQRIPEV